MDEFLDIINETKEEVDLELIKKVALYTLESENSLGSYLSIIIVDNKYIRKINNEYRHIDKETDVISFALEDDETFVKTPVRILGDIYISIDKAKSQAIDYSHSLKRELSFLTVHGILHLLGYDHMEKGDEEIMFQKQERILDELNIRR